MAEDPSGDDPALTYGRYLALDEVLGAQRPRSDEHDELLFIVVHQVYELWFKQLLHELAHLQARLVDGDTPHAVRTLRRILTILKVAVAQIDVIETMSPRQFTSFRDRLDASSGFQSWQFRELEAVLGRRPVARLPRLPGRHGYDADRPGRGACSSTSTPTTAGRPRWPSCSSTSTRACRSGATGT